MTPSRSQASSSPGGRAPRRAAADPPPPPAPPAPKIAESDAVEDQTSQQDLWHYLHIARRRIGVIVGITALVTLFALILSVAQSDVYRAKAAVLLVRQNLPAAATGRTIDSSLSEDPGRVATTQAALARSPAVAYLAVRQAGVSGVSAQDLLSRSSVTPNPDADVLVFSVDDGNAGDAARLANAYAAAYSVYKLTLDTNALQRARNELNTRLQKLRAHGQGGSDLYRTIANSEQQLHTLQLLQSKNSLLTSQAAGNRIKPTPKRDMLLGLGFGLLLGCGAAFLLEALDKRIRTENEIERELGLPLLARVPKPPRQTRHLTMLSAPTSVQADAVRTLATNIEFSSPDGPPQLLMVTSALKREGKSTTAADLAVALARSGKLVAVVDLDLREPSIASLFRLRVPTGLTNVIVGKATIDEALVNIPIPPLETGANGRPQLLAGSLNVIPTGPLPVNPSEFVKAAALHERVLAPLRTRFDHVIVDSPPMCIGGDALALSTRVDAVIVVARLGVVDRASLRDLTRQLATSGARVLGFVLTGVGAGDGYGYAYASEDEGAGLTRRILPVIADVAEKARRVRF
jgi:capsular exopolysaccharide synthesis family protein